MKHAIKSDLGVCDALIFATALESGDPDWLKTDCIALIWPERIGQETVRLKVRLTSSVAI